MTRAKLLIADNDPAIREILSVLLTEVGYQVRTAEDGFTALAEIRKDAPDVLLSDLNMPGMSGFELLCLVRDRFPGVQTIAMSGMFSGEEVPPGVTADAFYQKGTRMESLLRIMRSVSWHRRVIAGGTTASIPVPAQQQPVQRQDDADAQEADRTIICLKCVQMISMVENQTASQMRDIVCADCSRLIQSAFARSADRWSFLQSHEEQGAALPALNEAQQFDN
jgi:CheY-like chemotaxis protein